MLKDFYSQFLVGLKKSKMARKSDEICTLASKTYDTLTDYECIRFMCAIK